MLGKFWGNTNKGGFSVNLLRISLISTSRGTYTNQFKCPVETFRRLLFVHELDSILAKAQRDNRFHVTYWSYSVFQRTLSTKYLAGIKSFTGTTLNPQRVHGSQSLGSLSIKMLQQMSLSRVSYSK